MKLELVTRVKEKKDSTQVIASIRNYGREDVHLLDEFMLSRTTATLKDDEGRDLPARDAGAMRGMRSFSGKEVRTHLVRPGKAVVVAEFSLEPALHRAHAGDFSWNLERVQATALILVMTYEVSEEAAEIARSCGARDVAVGLWSSSTVTMQDRK